MNTVKTVAAQLIKEGKVEHPYLGIRALPIERDIARLFRLPRSSGLLVQDVVEGSGADKAGLRGGTEEVIVEGESWRLGGDIIIAADGKPVPAVERLRAIVARKRPGDTVELEIYRGDERMTLDVTLGRQPTSASPND